MLAQIRSNFKGKDIVSLDQFDNDSILKLFREARAIGKKTPANLINTLRGRIAALVFFEPSTRTFSSHAAAFKRLGGQTIDHQNPMATSSAVKGETVTDMGKMLEQYCDAIVMRHPVKGTLEEVADAVGVPVINAGDGVGEHPTQALLDMYTIWEKFGKLGGLTGLMAGDMLNGRTVHSLLKGLSFFPGNTVYLLSPEKLRLSRADLKNYSGKGIRIVEISKTGEIPVNCHFWYWTRVQKERFGNRAEYERLKLSFILTEKLIGEKAGRDTVFMHPLPRVGEIDLKVDSDPRALYLTKQVRNGMIIRMALFKLILKS